MVELLFYCRSGYEADLLGELDKGIGDKGHYGYAKFAKNDAFLRYTLPNVKALLKQGETKHDLNGKATHDGVTSQLQNVYHQFSQLCPKLTDFVFARQKLLIVGDIDFVTNDRVSHIVEFIQSSTLPIFSDVLVEYADSEHGNKMAKFCKKFTVPLRQELRKQKLLSATASDDKCFLHLFFQSSHSCCVAISFKSDRSTFKLGFQRLKMPKLAPSRSTLKLAEAISTFFNPAQAKSLFTEGMRAVDLGACPGGWTYQLVQRKLIVEAVDHGEIEPNLMQSGLVEYYPQDGFLYQPQQGNVDWLVCDMIEQPTRVSELMLTWLVNGQANAAIFNLKLPMNKRFKVVQPILTHLSEVLTQRFEQHILKCKHLYHNRDEVSVLIIVNSQLLHSYYSCVK